MKLCNNHVLIKVTVLRESIMVEVNGNATIFYE